MNYVCNIFQQISTFLALILLISHGLFQNGHSQDVSGIVSDNLGSALPGVRVTLFNADTSLFWEIRTDDSGNFLMSGVPQGTYFLGAASPNFEYNEVSITVVPNGVQYNFSLEEKTQQGKWNIIGPAGEAFGGTDSGVLLPDGRIILCHDTRDPVIFDPLDNSIEIPPPSPKIQGCHSTCLLQDGRVIYVAGADVPVYGPGTKQVKTYDPVTNSWDVLPDLLDFRWYPSLVQLPDGELLAAGGGGLENPLRVNTSELFDPATMTWGAVDTVEIGNEVSPIVLLHTGEVLMTHRPPQLYNPQTQQWRLAADFVQGNRTPDGDHADHEMTLLQDGRAVAIGFTTVYTPGDGGNLVEIYDPASDSWRLGANFLPLRSRAKVLPLPNKKILVMGGFKETHADPAPTNEWGYMNLTDEYGPQTDSWRRLANMNIAREYHALAILLPDARVFITAGEGQPGVEPEGESVIEIFDPPYLFRGVRPEIKNLGQTEISRGSQLTFTIEKTTAPTRVILMGTRAVTHFMNSGIERYVELNFTQNGSQITVQIPTNPATLPLGYYILFAMVDDIPSKGQIVKITNLPTGVPGVDETIPGQFKLYQNYPNPFNPATTIEYEISQPSLVSLKIFNILGEDIATLVAEQQSPGKYTIQWNAENLPSGIYLYQLTAGDFSKTKKLMLLK